MQAQPKVAEAVEVFGGHGLTLEPLVERPLVQQQAPSAGAEVMNPHRLLEVAVQRGLPIETIDKLLGLVERSEAMREAERKRLAEASYIRAIADLKSEVVAVVKTKRVHYPTKGHDGRINGSVDFKHAELSDIMEAIAPSAARVGLTWNYPMVDQGTDWIRVTCRLRHVDGHFEDLTIGGPIDVSGKKNDLQAIQSAITYLSRYTLKTILGIAEKGEDDDGNGGRPPGSDSRGSNARQADAPASEVAPKNVDGTPQYEELLDAGRGESMKGSKALTAWWGNLRTDQRDLIMSQFGSLKKAAVAADKAPT